MDNWTQIEMTRAKWFLKKLEDLSTQLGSTMNDEFMVLLKLEKLLENKASKDDLLANFQLLEQIKLDCWFYRSVYEHVKVEYEVLFNRKIGGK